MISKITRAPDPAIEQLRGALNRARTKLGSAMAVVTRIEEQLTARLSHVKKGDRVTWERKGRRYHGVMHGHVLHGPDDNQVEHLVFRITKDGRTTDRMERIPWYCSVLPEMFAKPDPSEAMRSRATRKGKKRA